MKQGLSLRVSQHLALTPQLQQSIRLLQLSTLELDQEVEQMLDDNPFLERANEEPVREEFGLNQVDATVTQEDREAEVMLYGPDHGSTGSLASTDSPLDSGGEGVELVDEPSWDGDGSVDIAADDSEWGTDAGARGTALGEEGERDATELARSQESLSAHLQRQVLALRLSEIDSAALRFLIDSLNDDGYLEESLHELAENLAAAAPQELEELEHRLRVALGLLQHLDPPGVGARHLAECLQLKIEHLRQHAPGAHPPALLELAERLCAQPLELLARRDVKRLMQVSGASDEQVRAALALISRLEPKPGRRFADVERNVIVPDVIVLRLGHGASTRLRVQLNSEVLPRLRVHDVYASALRGYKGEGGAALQQRLQEARWFIKNIQQRFDTILRVSNAIVERQKNFFMHGALAMRPLVLREIADELGLHESTISRVTTAKYMATPYGTFELKYFFGSALGTETGGNASSTAVRALIQQFVAGEDAHKPLSDNQIAQMLQEQGIECARRTVAKYREALRIAPANLRKAL